MLFLLAPFLTLSLTLADSINVSVMVGSISHPRNPFWSQPHPGIHFCPDGDPLPIEDSDQQRKLVLPLNSSPAAPDLALFGAGTLRTRIQNYTENIFASPIHSVPYRSRDTAGTECPNGS
jgi:hypothetical protein